MFLDISAGDKFLDMTPTELARKPKMDKWDYIKLNNFGTAKQNEKAVQRMGENIYCINHIYNNGSISKMYKEVI